jgi:hypothetical protein
LWSVSSRKADKERLRAERIAREESERHARARRRRVVLGVGAATLAALAATLVVLVTAGGSKSSSSTPPARSGLLASTEGEAAGSTVNGIQCQTQEQVLFHIHAHLAVYVDGRTRLVPEGIGIAPPHDVEQSSDGPFVAGGACFYWLHSHTRDGIIHIESPVKRVYTLGDYFDIWKQPLGANQVGPAKGRVTAYVDGHRFEGDPRSIPLKAHALIQLDVGTPVVAPQHFAFPPGL